MRQALLAALVLGILAVAVVVQEAPKLQTAEVEVKAARLYDWLVDWIRPFIPGANTIAIGWIIWGFFKWIIIPLILFLIWWVSKPKWKLILLVVFVVIFIF